MFDVRLRDRIGIWSAILEVQSSKLVENVLIMPFFLFIIILYSVVPFRISAVYKLRLKVSRMVLVTALIAMSSSIKTVSYILLFQIEMYTGKALNSKQSMGSDD